MSGYPVLTIGDAAVDIVVRASGPLAYSTDTIGQVRLMPGGSGANVAVWIARAGVPSRFAGAVGDDLAGELLTRDLAREGVDARLVVIPGATTTAVAVLVDDRGESTMVTDRDAETRFDAGHVTEDLFASVRHLHVTGYSYLEEAPRRSMARAAEIATRRRISRSLDPATTSLLGQRLGRDRFLELTAETDIVFPNQLEAEFLTGESDTERAAEHLLRWYPIVCLKLRIGGCRIATRDGLRVHVPHPRAEAVDTTGGGDAFAGAFLAALMKGRSLEEAGRAGSVLAAKVVTMLGARPAVEVEE